MIRIPKIGTTYLFSMLLTVTLISRIGWAEYLIERYKWTNQIVVFYTPLSLFLFFINRIREPSVLSFLTWHKMDNKQDNIRASSSWLTNGRWIPKMTMNFILYNEFLGAALLLRCRNMADETFHAQFWTFRVQQWRGRIFKIMSMLLMRMILGS